MQAWFTTSWKSLFSELLRIRVCKRKKKEFYHQNFLSSKRRLSATSPPKNFQKFFCIIFRVRAKIHKKNYLWVYLRNTCFIVLILVWKKSTPIHRLQHHLIININNKVSTFYLLPLFVQKKLIAAPLDDVIKSSSH